MQNLKVISIESLNVERPSSEKLQRKSCSVSLPNTFSLQGGELFIDGTLVPSCFTRGFFYWEREQQGSERGCIKLMHHGLLSQGVIEQNGIRRNFTATASNIYHLFYKKDGKEIPWCDFKMGVRKDADGDYVTYGELYIDGNLLNPEYCKVLFSVTKEGLLHADIRIAQEYLAFSGVEGMCWQASFDFSYNYEQCENGKFYPYTLESGCVETPWELTGYCLMEQSRALKAQRTKEPSNSQTMHLLKKRSLDLTQDTPLSVTDLFDLPAPDMAQIHEKSMNTLYNLMIYHCDDMTFTDNKVTVKWIDWFNKEKAIIQKSLEPEDIQLLSDPDIRSFVEEYALAVLTDMFSSTDNSEIKSAMAGASGSPDDKMLFYFKGNGDKGLAKNPKFNTAISAISQNIYCRFVNGFEKYIKSNAPADWAKKLYDRCMKSIDQLQVQQLSGGCTRVNHLCMLLNFLDKEKRVPVSGGKSQNSGTNQQKEGEKPEEEKLTYAIALYGQVFNNSLVEMIEQWRHDDQSSMVEVMRKLAGIYVNKVLYDTSLSIESDALAEIKKDLQELAAEYSLTTEEEITNKVIELAEEFSSMAADLANLPLASIFHKTRLSIGVVASIVPIFLCVKGFINWDQMDALHKSEYVLDFTSASMNLFCTSNNIQALRTLTNAEATIEERINAAMRLKFSGIDPQIVETMSKAGGTTVTKAMIGAGRYTASATAADGSALQISKWTRFSRIADVAARAFNLIAMGFAIFIISMDIKSEFNDKYMWDSIKGIDIMQDICMGVSVLMDIASLTLDALSITCSAIPIVGAVVAIIGIVFAVVSSILHSKYKPKTIVTAFIEQKVIPFVNGLDTPDKAWLKENKTAAA